MPRTEAEIDADIKRLEQVQCAQLAQVKRLMNRAAEQQAMLDSIKEDVAELRGVSWLLTLERDLHLEAEGGPQ